MSALPRQGQQQKGGGGNLGYRAEAEREVRVNEGGITPNLFPGEGGYLGGFAAPCRRSAGQSLP